MDNLQMIGVKKGGNEMSKSILRHKKPKFDSYRLMMTKATCFFILLLFGMAKVVAGDLLSDSEVENAKLQAINGNSEAAYKLGIYYQNPKTKFVNDIHYSSLYWLRKSASLYNVKAIKSLGYDFPYKHSATIYCGNRKIILESKCDFLNSENQEARCSRQNLSFYSLKDDLISTYKFDTSKYKYSERDDDNYLKVAVAVCLQDAKENKFYLILRSFDPVAFVSDMSDRNDYFYNSKYLGSDNPREKIVLKKYYRNLSKSTISRIEENKTYIKKEYRFEYVPSREETSAFFKN